MTATTSTGKKLIRLGTRKSNLAMVQTHWVQDALQQQFPDYEFEIVSMKTQGDKIQDVSLSKIGDKGLFTKELELGLLNNDVDLAVHSLKDLPTQLPDNLMLGGITSRENPADALVLNEKYQGYTIDTLPAGAVVGTSSLRRLAQLRHHFPHLEFKDVRGNLNTRLRKVDSGDYDALVLAVAGLERLGMGDRVAQSIPGDYSMHAVGQGALGLECREGDNEILAIIQAIEDPETRDRTLAERAFLRELEGGCQVPIGVNSSIVENQLTLTGMVASLDGQQLLKDTISSDRANYETIGYNLAQKLREKGAQPILDEIFAQVDRQ